MRRTFLSLLWVILFLGQLGASPVKEYGLLTVREGKIVGKHGREVSLAGNSLFWSQWDRNGFWNADCVNWLVKDWKSSMIRLPMGIEDPGGYLERPKENEEKVRRLADAVIKAGAYVIINWHSHKAEDAADEAARFFERMARDYGHHEHVIYEIYNEPVKTPWPEIKKYAEKVIAAIRKHDPDNLIVVGSRQWSQKVTEPATDPIEGRNIAYSLHFYSAMHGKDLRAEADKAIEKGLPLFVTEWGPVGNEDDDLETKAWMDWCRKHQLCHCAWAVNDKVEAWSVVKEGVNPRGDWTEDDLTPAGTLERQIISSWEKK